MGKPLFSIVVPVYNVEAYLEETIESILSQEFTQWTEWELLLVDDGSTDRSGEICDSYALSYPDRIRGFHKNNEGLLLTRRFGFRQAEGEYIINCDSDDTLESNTLQTLEAAIIRTGADVVIYNMNTWDGTNKQPFSENIFTQRDFYEPTKEEVYRAFFAHAGAASLCGKTFRRSCLDLDRDYSDYPKKSYGEDTLQSTEIYTNAKTFAYCNQNLYNYRCGSGMTGKFNPDYFDDFRKVHLALADCKEQWQLSDFDALFSEKVLSCAARAITQSRYHAAMTYAQRVDYLKKLREDPLIKQCEEGYSQVRKNMKRSYRILLDLFLKRQYGAISILLGAKNALSQVKDWKFLCSKILMFGLPLSLTISFCEIDNVIAYTPMAFWCVLALAKWIANTPRMTNKHPKLHQLLADVGLERENEPSAKGVLGCFAGYNMGSRVVIYLYTVLLVILGLTEKQYLSTNAMTFVNGVSAISVFYLFGSKSVYYSLVAICGAWFIELLQAIFAPGNHSFQVNMELHDLSFGAGYVFLYYLFAHYKWTKKHVFCLVTVVIAILIAFKRIGIAALALTVVLWFVLRLLRSNKTRRTFLRWGSVAMILGCYIFVALLITGAAADLLESVGIKTMGRNYYYEALAGKCEFSPWFLGLGRNAVATLFATEFEYFHVGNVHSDILRMYAECGFIVFGLWLWVYWWALPRAIEKRFGYQAMEFYLLCTVYTFVVYITDNTELYLVNQYFYMLMPMFVAINAESISRYTRFQSARWKRLLGKKE